MFDYLSEDDFDPDGYSEDDIEAILGRIPAQLPAYDTKKPQEEKRGSGRKLSLETVDARIEKAYAGRVERTGDYHGRFSHMRVRCKACSKEVTKYAQNLFEGQWLFCDCKRPRRKK